MILVCAFLIGLAAGLRTMMAPAVVSWAARLGILAVANTPLAFMGYKYVPILFTVLAAGELIGDKLPKTPSRKTPPQFIARIVSGALTGATLGATVDMIVAGTIIGALGAVAGTLGGAAARAKLSIAFRNAFFAAVFEDIVAIAISVISVLRFG